MQEMAENTQESTDINESKLFPLQGELIFIYTKSGKNPLTAPYAYWKCCYIYSSIDI